MAEALYRKYRPQIFEDVVGQEHIERTIKNAIAQDKVSHAYLFTGPRGTGKTTTARLLAKALLCETGPTAEPDGTCEDCELIAAGEHPDVYELDAASRTGVENVREEIIGRVQFAPTRGRYKVYIIDEVHMLSTAAFNALLKTLEEPPSHVVFILATTDPQKVPETIHSRCQRFDFRRISTEAMVSRLGAICVAEGVEFEGEALDLIAHRAEGGMRNALTSLEQLIAFGDGAVTMEVAERMLGTVDSTDLADIVQAIGARDAAACFTWVAEYVETGADLAQFVGDLATHLRNMYVMAVAGADVVLEVSEGTRRELAAELPLFGVDRLAYLLDVLGDVASDLKTSTNARLSFEIALTRMVRPSADLTLQALAARVEELERQIAAGATASALGIAPIPAVVAPAPMPTPPAPAPAPVPPAAVPTTAPEEREDAAASASSVPDPSPASASVSAVPEPSAPVALEPAPAPVSAPASNAPAPIAPASDASVGAAFRPPAPAPSVPDPAVAPAAPAAPAASGALSPQLAEMLGNPAALQRLWAGVLATLKRVKITYGVLFINTRVTFNGKALVIEFSGDNDFAFQMVQKPDAQEELARALRQEARAEVPFELRRAAGGAAPSAAVPAAGGVAAPNPVAAAAARAAAGVAAVAPYAPAPTVPVVPASELGAPTAPAAPAAPPAPAPVAQASPASAPTPSTVEEVPPWEDDRPPYDDYVPSDASDERPGEVPPWEDAPAAEPQAPAPAMAPSAGLPPEPDSVSGPSPNPVMEPDDADLNASLAFGFGDGISFEEVS
ncbi:DNA polymerase III subunit gamma/tau [Adlercreutzia sp. R21]|uniref:DNA polymerase III subunit gamma/tau n=1 Tax=Adlercreutzia wanghongyangiae TaxID=3111451 RepID=UPI002DB88B32|nr:DNA polymerase III subunit gamma/tau [Adlercreutzia sp. R21]MEC4185238.1 DNA polymerase III subunit gamma/tau [Adlercreutzia sp. R21]